ncbi:MAG: hypothetical protein IH822_09600 [Chloroflexi bacterium]|nr:hypothetical protein [Chloroflexota bacterium]
MTRAAAVIVGGSLLSLFVGGSREWFGDGAEDEPVLILLVGVIIVVTLASAYSLRANASVIEGVLLGSLYGSLAWGFLFLGAGAGFDLFAIEAAFGAVGGTVCGAVGWVLRFALGRLAASN